MVRNDVDITQLESVIVTWVGEVLPRTYASAKA